MQKKERFKKVIEWFKENVPIAESELNHSNPYELIVATILSAQCTDKRVNMVTPDFFKQYPTVYKLADADVDSIYEPIKSISFPNNKAKHLLGMAQLVVSRFNGKIPDTVEELESLPGVGRKTANVVASIIYNKPVIAVDTHVFRVSARIGLSTNAKTPLETEKQLEAYIPEEYRAIAHHWLILHGRYICVSRKPKCRECGLTPYCKYYATEVSIR
ncbi:MAG: endonuclease III [Prevotellaceae bacterium]|jgi:endonuclease-3|nr:endonuclease III [Prevotellaceae bacterium]